MKNFFVSISATVLTFSILSCVAVPVDVKSTTAPTFYTSKYHKIAVVINPDKRLPARLVEDEFIKELIGKSYIVSSRSDVKSIVKELQLQQSGLTDKDAVKIGKLLNVPAVLIVNLNKMERRRGGDWIDVTLGSRIIDIETADIVWIATSEDTATRLGYDSLIIDISRALAKNIPRRGNYIVDFNIKSIESGSLRHKKPKKLAVIVLPNRYIRQRLIEDTIIMKLIEKGYRISSRSDIEAVIKEHKFQRSGITDRDVSEIGKILNVPAIMIVSCNYYKRHYGKSDMISVDLGARLIDVELAEILWVGTTHSYRIRRSYDETKAAEELISDFPKTS